MDDTNKNAIMQLCRQSPNSHFERSLRSTLSRYRGVKRLAVTTHSVADQHQTIKRITAELESQNTHCGSSNVETLVLVGLKSIPEALAQALGTFLSDAYSLRALEIHECNLSPAQYRIITRGFARNLHLECVRIDGIHLSFYTAVIFFDALAAAPRLRHLVLQSIDMQCGDVDSGIGGVLMSTVSLWHLEIELALDTRYAGLLQGLSKNRTIETLTVKLTSMNKDEGQALVDALAKASGLLSLHVQFGREVPKKEIGSFTRAIASMLEVNNTLQTLSLSHADPTDVVESSENLLACELLISALERNSGLVHFHMKYRLDIYMAAAGAYIMGVAGVIENNTRLRTLDLSGIRLLDTCSGDHTDRLLHALDKNNTLVHLVLNISLNMYYNDAEVNPFAWRQRHGRHNGDSDSTHNNSSQVPWIRTLQNNRTIQTLVLSHTGSFSAQLPAIPLHRLNISCQTLSSAQMHDLGSYLAHNTSLHALNLSNINPLTWYNALHRADTTTTGTLSNDQFVPISNALALNTSLRHLSISSTNIRNNSAGILTRGLSKNVTLQSLNISDNNQISTEGMQAICTCLWHNTSLCALNVGYISQMGSFEAVSNLLARNTTLQHLSVEVGSDTLGCARKLIHSKTLQSVQIVARTSSFSRDDTFLKEIALALRHNTLIRHLHIEYKRPSAAWLEVFDTLLHYPRPRTLELKIDCDFLPNIHTTNIHTSSSSSSSSSSSLHGAIKHTSSAKDWADADILDFLRDVHVHKIIAFCMGHHARLGKQSPVQNMAPDSLKMVMLSYFALPMYDYKDPPQPRRDAAYLRVLEEMALLQ